jgi:hypothetical protein
VGGGNRNDVDLFCITSSGEACEGGEMVKERGEKGVGVEIGTSVKLVE